MQKHVSSELAWEEVVHMIITAYNFVPNEHSKLSVLFLNITSLFALDAFRDVYALAIHNIKLPRERQAEKFLMHSIPKFNVGDKVLVRNHTRDVWELKYDVVYYVVWVMGTQLELIEERW